MNIDELQAALAHGFKKNDSAAIGRALIAECQLRTEAEERIEKNLDAVAQAVTDITQSEIVNYSNNRKGIQTQVDTTQQQLDALKEQLQGDENGVLRIETLYVGQNIQVGKYIIIHVYFYFSWG